MNNNTSRNYGLFRLFLLSLSLAIPLIVIGAPGWIIALASVYVFSPLLFKSELLLYITAWLYDIVLRPGLYVWALIVAINGPQDFVAIAFYILAFLQAWSILKNLISQICQLILLFGK